MAKKDVKPGLVGEISIKVYDDYSANFTINGDDDWLSAAIAAGLENDRFSSIVAAGAQALFESRTQEEEEAPKEKKAKKKAKK
jgi:hypothetical protein